MSIKTFFAYVKVIVAGLFFLLVFMLYFSNADNKCSNLHFFAKTFNDVSLAKIMPIFGLVGIIAVFMAKILFTGSRTIYSYRKQHPIIKPSQEEPQDEGENENLSENQ